MAKRTFASGAPVWNRTWAVDGEIGTGGGITGLPTCESESESESWTESVESVVLVAVGVGAVGAGVVGAGAVSAGGVVGAGGARAGGVDGICTLCTLGGGTGANGKAVVLDKRGPAELAGLFDFDKPKTSPSTTATAMINAKITQAHTGKSLFAIV